MVKGIEIDRNREKLIRLLSKAEMAADKKGFFNCNPHIEKAKFVADYLIANGVRFEKKQATSDKNEHWISVKERLPEMKADVLMYFLDDKNMAVGYLCDVDEDRTMWCAYTDGGFYTDCDYEPSHWMPLPEPPKGE